MKKISAILAISTLALAACGSDDGGGGGGDSDSGAKAELLEELTGEDIEGLDNGCIEDKVDDLSDSDAAFLVDNIDAEEIPDGASEAAVEFATSLFDCFDIGDLDLGDIDVGDLGS